MIWDDLIDENFHLQLPVLSPEGRVLCASDAKPEPWSTDANWRSWRLMIWPVMPRHLRYPGIVGELGDIMPNNIIFSELASPNYLTWRMKKPHNIYQSQPPNVPQKPNDARAANRWPMIQGLVSLLSKHHVVKAWLEMLGTWLYLLYIHVCTEYVYRNPSSQEI